MATIIIQKLPQRIMYKRTTMGLVIATILIAYISAFMLSNQAFAQVGINPNPVVAFSGSGG
jgi:hypothetical protein